MTTPFMWEGESYKKAAEKFKSAGSLGVTAEDHKAIGGTPPDELVNNPGKTFLEIMSDEEVLQWLKEQKAKMEDCLSDEYEENPGVQDFLVVIRQNLGRSIEYLRQVERLPSEFADLELS